MKYNSIVAALITGEAKITFTKKDGSVRTILGTLNNNFAPIDIDYTKILPEQDVVKFWSLDDNGWRSFRVENYKGFEGNLVTSYDEENNKWYHPVLRAVAPQLEN